MLIGVNLFDSGHPETVPSHGKLEEDAMARARRAERKHRRREAKSEGPIPPPKQTRRGQIPDDSTA
jgi:hypothetical protein